MRNALVCTLVAFALTAPTPVKADVGDVVSVITPQPGSVGNFCSVGVAFDGTSLYFDRCDDPLIYEISPLTGAMISSFDPNIPELPNAMAFDGKRNGLWIGAQNCNANGMPIYFYDFDLGSSTLMFTIPTGLVNPATNTNFLVFCFCDGLAYNEHDPTLTSDDEIWFSDDVNRNIGLFRPDGTLVAGYDGTTIDASLSSTSGLAVGGSNLYLGNNGGGDVFRASLPGVTFLDQFESGDDRQEDMECDPITFAPTEVMWVRTTPQGGLFPDVITAYEIEPGTCGVGGGECFLVTGTGPGSTSFNPGNHVFHPQVDQVVSYYPVLMDDVPSFPLATPTAPAPWSPFGGATLINQFPDPYGRQEFYVQVLMWNPQVFPQHPEQWTQGLRVVVLPDGRLFTRYYGVGTGMGITVEAYRDDQGQPRLRFPFTIPGI